ncbi:MAG: DUF4303 domain-containing protein [Chloroflexi bacterium]|nr:DUF4303 domain-containing protein [Chloroflexota bacterium]
MTDSIDLHELEILLLEASRTAFIDVQQKHPDEHFYAFSLIHEPLWEGIYLASNTEEALLRCAERYQQMPYHAHKSLAELVMQLRWPSGDWEYIEPTHPAFKAVDDWLLMHILREWIDEFNDEEIWDARYDEVIEICRSVLRQLDSEGIFGVGDAREQVTIHIMMGDQDRSWLEYARQLNPPAAFQRWIQPLVDEDRY